MTYDFDKPIDRRNTYSEKWNVGENELPMWVADMDFETAPEIKEAILKRAEHGVFGYTLTPDAWYDAYIHWWEKRHNFTIQREWLLFSTGVVASISSIVRKLTTPAEKVLIQTPVYNVFFNSILNNGRQVLESPLVYDGENYHIDFEDLEEKLADPQTTLMILCNPHNPIGKLWDWMTLSRIGQLCKKHNVVIISDEIHCDLTSPGVGYIPFASVNAECRDNSITCIAPTKTFNLAGIQTSAVVIPNELLRHKVWRALNTDEVAEPNAFAVDAAIAAFEHGGAWLDELRAYIQNNREIAAEYIKTNIPQVHLVESEATYLLWIDARDTYSSNGTTEKPSGYSSKNGAIASKGQHNQKISEIIREKTGLFLSEGSLYGKTGEGFLRMNIACPKATLMDGLVRLKDGLN